jgi:hypothetical protein
MNSIFAPQVCYLAADEFMNKKISPSTPTRLKPARLLLTQRCSLRIPAAPPDPQVFSFKALAVTALLGDIVLQKRHSHWGINE